MAVVWQRCRLVALGTDDAAEHRQTDVQRQQHRCQQLTWRRRHAAHSAARPSPRRRHSRRNSRSNSRGDTTARTTAVCIRSPAAHPPVPALDWCRLQLWGSCAVVRRRRNCQRARQISRLFSTAEFYLQVRISRK